MRSARLWPLLALIPWLAGCPYPIFSEQPLGGEIVILDPGKVDGMWLGPDDYLLGIRVVDAKKGRFAHWTASKDGLNGPLRCQPPSWLRNTCTFDDGTCTLRQQKVPGARWPFFFVEWRRDSDQVYATTGVATSDERSFAVVYSVSGYG